MIDQVSSKIKTAKQLIKFSPYFKGLPQSTVTKIVEQTLPNIKQVEEVEYLLSEVGKYLSGSTITRMTEQIIIPHIKDSGYGSHEVIGLLNAGKEYFSESDIIAMEREALLDVTSVDGQMNRLRFLNKLWSLKSNNNTEESIKKRKAFIDKILDRIETAKGGTEFLRRWGSDFSDAERKQVMKSILDRIRTARGGAELLRLGSVFSDAERKQVMKSILDRIETAEGGVELLRLGSDFSDAEKHQIASKAIKTNKELKAVRGFLSKSSYDEIRITIKKNRINCLKNQLSSVFRQK